MKFENTEVYGFKRALKGMRNPLESWHKNDTVEENGKVVIGENDLDLAQRLIKSGSEHRKFMRQIFVSVDITGPLYWWKEFDTYKVGTVANSCSTMHKIAAKEFTLEDFSIEHLMEWEDYESEAKELKPTRLCNFKFYLMDTISALNNARDLYLQTNDKKYWWQMIQLLPSSYNQRRTVMLNYEVLANIYKSRRNHKLDEWRELCDWIESLPYSELITGPDLSRTPICDEIIEEAKKKSQDGYVRSNTEE